ncbi:hypothetical protein SBV1_2400005 [Verrucomicrobia bacterium]|nr:hypothetical protein SBV1_2400005 [Verrucomicrobiota bacterium]
MTTSQAEPRFDGGSKTELAGKKNMSKEPALIEAMRLSASRAIRWTGRLGQL